MFESIVKFFNKVMKKENKVTPNSKEAAKERLHLVLMQDRANVSADFLELMKQEIIEVIKKYIDIDEGAIDVRLTNKENEDGTNGAPALYANIPILNIKNEARKIEKQENKKEDTQSDEDKEKHTEEKKSKQEKDNENSNKKVENEEEKEEQTENIIEQKEEKNENKKENIDLENKENITEKKDTKEKSNQND